MPAVGLGVFFGIDPGSGPAHTHAAKPPAPVTGRVLLADATGKLTILAPSGRGAQPLSLDIPITDYQGASGYLSPASN